MAQNYEMVMHQLQTIANTTPDSAESFYDMLSIENRCGVYTRGDSALRLGGWHEYSVFDCDSASGWYASGDCDSIKPFHIPWIDASEYRAMGNLVIVEPLLPECVSELW